MKLNIRQNITNTEFTNFAESFTLNYFHPQNHEDPETFCAKQTRHVPVLLATSEQATIIIGKQIICEVDTKKLDEAVIAHLAAFYLLDFDYPKISEVGMTMLQYSVFKVPLNLLGSLA